VTRETELSERLAEMRRQRDAGMKRITDLLAGGSDTAAARAEVALQERRIADTEQQLADAGAQREAEAQEAISAAAAVIAVATHDAVQARLRVLELPQHP
jgi:uncharacterized protein YhaN